MATKKFKFKGPTKGAAFGIDAAGATRSVSTWGEGGTIVTPPTPPVVTGTFNGKLHVVDLLEGTTGDAVVITSQPTGTKITAQSDGKVSVDLTQYASAAPVVFTYQVTKEGSSSVDGTCTLNVVNAQEYAYYNKSDVYVGQIPAERVTRPGRHFVFPKDANGNYVVEQSTTCRVVYVAGSAADGTYPAGKNKAAIAALAGVSEGTVTTSWLWSSIYGRTAETALDETQALALWNTYALKQQRQTMFLFRRGDTFTGGFGKSTSGLNRRHASVIGNYGHAANAWPVLPSLSVGDAARYLVPQGFQTTGTGAIGGAEFVAVDGFKMSGHEFSCESRDFVRRGLTVRHFIGLDAQLDGPSKVKIDTASGRQYWDGSGDKCSGFFIASAIGLLLEENFVDHGGWGEPYAMDTWVYDTDGTTKLGQPPIMYNHCFYLDSHSSDLTFRRNWATRASFSGAQLRPGGIIEDNVVFGSNAGLAAVGAGMLIPQDPAGYNAGAHTWIGRNWITAAGQKQNNRDSLARANGTRNETPFTSVIGWTLTHSGPGTPVGEYGPSGRAESKNQVCGYVPDAGKTGSTFFQRIVQRNWVPNIGTVPDISLATTDTAALDNATIGGWLAQRLDNPSYAALSMPEQIDAVAEWLRTLAAPWAEVQSALFYTMDPAGFETTNRSSATTLTFKPYSELDNGTLKCPSPGIRWDCGIDWIATDGTRWQVPQTGDSVNLAGHRVYACTDLPNGQLVNFTFGAGGELIMYGGKLSMSGTVTGATGAALTVAGNADFWCDGLTGALDVVVDEDGRFLNSGTISGINVTARGRGQAILGYDGSSFTVSSGKTLEVEGVTAGYDGTTGGAAGITIASGGTLKLRPRVIVSVTGLASPTTGAMFKWKLMPRVGSTITGLSSGATATVLDYEMTSATTAKLVLGDFAGGSGGTAPFVVGETMYGLSVLGMEPRAATNLCQVSALEWSMGAIGDVVEGPGTATVASTFTRGGTLDADGRGLPAGTYTLIKADTLAGSWATQTVTGGTINNDTAGEVRLIVS